VDKDQGYPSQQGPDSDQLISSRSHVDDRVILHVFLAEASIKEANHHNRQASNEVEHGDEPLIEQRCAAIQGLRSKHNKHTGHDSILVKGKQHHRAQAEKVPAAVNEDQIFQEAELRNGEVGRINCLLSFFAGDPNTDVSLGEGDERKEMLRHACFLPMTK
jgi:hypothetical protein